MIVSGKGATMSPVGEYQAKAYTRAMDEGRKRTLAGPHHIETGDFRAPLNEIAGELLALVTSSVPVQ